MSCVAPFQLKMMHFENRSTGNIKRLSYSSFLTPPPSTSKYPTPGVSFVVVVAVESAVESAENAVRVSWYWEISTPCVHLFGELLIMNSSLLLSWFMRNDLPWVTPPKMLMKFVGLSLSARPDRAAGLNCRICLPPDKTILRSLCLSNEDSTTCLLKFVSSLFLRSSEYATHVIVGAGVVDSDLVLKYLTLCLNNVSSVSIDVI